MNKYLKNQKGIVLPPLLIWAVIAVGSIFIAQDAVKKGYIEINLPSSEQVETVITTPSPEPTLIPIPSVKPTVAPTTNTQQKVNTTQVTHDGSRTGPIVDNYSFCEQKTIKVYENERVPYKLAGGNTFYATRADIKCYEDQIRQLVNDAGRSQGNSYQPPSTYIQPPSLPPYEPPKFNIPPPPKIEPYDIQYPEPTFTVAPPLKFKVEPKVCYQVVPPGFGGRAPVVPCED